MAGNMKKRLEHPLERVRHPGVYAPGEELPKSGKRERIFLPGGITILAITLVSLGLEVWFRLHGGMQVIACFFLDCH
jgi:hypothetical protein